MNIVTHAFKKWSVLYLLLAATVGVIVLKGISLIDEGFAIGLGLLFVLGFATIWGLKKAGVGEWQAVTLFVIALLTHTLFASFVYFSDFQPFGGGQGDYQGYHRQAEYIAQGLLQGDFSGGGQFALLDNYYPAIIGVLYAVLFPSMIIGQLFNVWVAALSLVILYCIVRELGGTRYWALATGLIASIYPSFSLYTSILLKDVFVVFFTLLGLLIALKMMRRFTWQLFALLYIALIALTHFRFYTGIIFIVAISLSWIFFSHLEWRKRFLYAAIMIPLFGFIPHIASGLGYFGWKAISHYGNEEQIVFYKENVYSPNVVAEKIIVQQAEELSIARYEEATPQIVVIPEERELLVKEEVKTNKEVVAKESFEKPTGYSSSVDLSIDFENIFTFITSFVKSFLFAALGPYPWQFTESRHNLVLLETIPWYFLLFFIGRGAVRSFKEDRRALLLLLFGVGLLALIALFFSNFGITTRIRMSAFLALLPFIPFAFQSFWRDSAKATVLHRKHQIKICHIATIDFAIRFLTFNQLCYFKQKGYDVSVICSPGPWVSEIERAGIRVHAIPMSRSITPFKDVVSFFRLLYRLNKERFDIVHTYTPKAGLLGTWAAALTRVPIIIHSNLGFYFHEHSPWLKKHIFIWVERLSVLFADVIFSVDKEDMVTAKEEGIGNPESLRYLGGWVDLKRFDPDKFPPSFVLQKKRELGIEENQKVIGIVARLVREKGYVELFEAFQKILQKHPNTVLLSIGPEEPEKFDAVDIRMAKRYGIEEHTMFLGVRTDVQELYTIMDVFVLPTYREGIATSILEASAMKLPIVATNVRGCREAVDNGKSGILVPHKNPEKLAEALLWILEHPNEAREMGEAGRKKVEREFNEDIVFQRLEKEYERLMKEV